MDRRQRKTRAAVFAAFSGLLDEKSYGSITVREIIERADVGRTTFYAHFSTKDDLLRELCEELFGHVINSAVGRSGTVGTYSDATPPESALCHLLQHLRKNENNVLNLLSCESNNLFLRYFKDSLTALMEAEMADGCAERLDVPHGYLVNHLTGSFVETVLWWARRGLVETPEELDAYFRAVAGQLLKPPPALQAGERRAHAPV